MTLVCRELDLDVKRYNPRADPELDQHPQERAGRPRVGGVEGRNHLEETYAECYRTTRSGCAANALDFDDLMMTTVNLLQAFPEVRETTAADSGTCSSTSTRTPTTRSTR